MPTLHRLDHPTDKTCGGVLVGFDDGHAVTISWASKTAIDPHTAAKEYAAKVMQHLADGGRYGAVRDTNWVSLAAALGKHVADFNARLPVCAP